MNLEAVIAGVTANCYATPGLVLRYDRSDVLVAGDRHGELLSRRFPMDLPSSTDAKRVTRLVARPSEFGHGRPGGTQDRNAGPLREPIRDRGSSEDQNDYPDQREVTRRFQLRSPPSRGSSGRHFVRQATGSFMRIDPTCLTLRAGTPEDPDTSGPPYKQRWGAWSQAPHLD